MDALLRIRTKDGSEVLKSKIDDVVSKKKKQLKSPKVPKVPKAPKGVSVTRKNGDFAKFTPLKTTINQNPLDAWDDENTDELTSAVDLSDDGKFETEDDVFTKQDKEWQELMKEADMMSNIDANDKDDASSEVPDDTPSEASFDDDISDVSNIDDDISDVTTIDSDLEDGDVFCRYTAKEPRGTIKSMKIYSGIPIDFDDD